MQRFKLGADPELFLKDAADAFVSSIGLIGGSKQHPLPLPIGDGFAVQEDNVALEYNIPPSASRDDLITNINRAMVCLTEGIAPLGLKFARESAVLFPEDQLKDPRAREFGCEPDFDAWKDGAVNPRPKADDHRLRSCGGHVHIGLDGKHTKAEIERLMRMMDLCLAVPATVLDDGHLRKQLYGKRGAFRYKPYGAEYRVLSNFWTLENKLIGWVWDATSMAVDAWQNKKIDVDAEDKAIEEAVNNNNREVAMQLKDKYNLLFA
jgi:hypothetical protein